MMTNISPVSISRIWASSKIPPPPGLLSNTRNVSGHSELFIQAPILRYIPAVTLRTKPFTTLFYGVYVVYTIFISVNEVQFVNDAHNVFLEVGI